MSPSTDEVRRFWDARPCNIRHSAHPIGSLEYFHEVEARKYFVEPHIPPFADFARWEGKRVLEIGCGIGTDTASFARAGADLTAVDLSPVSVDLTRRRLEGSGLANRVQLYVADAERLSETVPVQPFDLVYSFGVLHHTPHPDRALTEARRFLAPGGTLKLMLYHRRSWKVAAIVVRHGAGQFWRSPELVARHSEAQTGCPVTYTYTRRQARALVQQAGFRVVQVDVDHIFSWRVPDYVVHRYVKARPWRWMPDRTFHWLERQIGWHLLISAVAI